MTSIFTDAQIEDAFAHAPAAVRQAIEDGISAKVVLAIGKKRGLQAERIGAFSETVRNMLIGLLSPAELPGALASIMPPDSVATVVDELNRSLVVPLQEYVKNPEKEMEPGVFLTALETSSDTKTLVPPPSLVSPAPTPAPARPVPQVPVAIAASQPPAPVPAPAVSVASPVPGQATASAPVAWQPELRTMAHDIEAMKNGDHSEPAPPRPAAPSVAPAPAPVPPPSQPDPWAAPVTPPPVNSVPSMTRTPNPDPEELTQGLKKYGIDPYREPVE